LDRNVEHALLLGKIMVTLLDSKLKSTFLNNERGLMFTSMKIVLISHKTPGVSVQILAILIF